MGKIILEGMEFFAHHGLYAEEQKLGNRYTVDLEVSVNFAAAAQTDQLQGTINYEKLYQVVASTMEKPAKLMEYVGQQIIDAVKSTFIEINEVSVKVSKHNPPVHGLCSKASVIVVG